MEEDDRDRQFCTSRAFFLRELQETLCQDNCKYIRYPFDHGRTLGLKGSAEGIILRDEANVDGARITLERDAGIVPFAISCGIYGWMVHTRYFSNEAEAQQEFDKMQVSLDEILRRIPFDDDPDLDAKIEISKREISKFVELYP